MSLSLFPEFDACFIKSMVFLNFDLVFHIWSLSDLRSQHKTAKPALVAAVSQLWKVFWIFHSRCTTSEDSQGHSSQCWTIFCGFKHSNGQNRWEESKSFPQALPTLSIHCWCSKYHFLFFQDITARCQKVWLIVSADMLSSWGACICFSNWSVTNTPTE